MRCSACGAESAPAAKFCQECGARLVRACARCGHEAGPTAKFCADCGAELDPTGPSTTDQSDGRDVADVPVPTRLARKILGSRAALEGERKQVTALFADVVDSTPLAEALGPEETHGLIRRCFDLMLDAVHRYEGTVSQFTGDGILALFGAPIAHEDHAQRAVRAGLAIQQALQTVRRELAELRGLAFQVRIGVNSGPVVVGTIGTDLNMTYTAIGDTVNLASRIQGLAEPGTVVVSEATHRLVGHFFVTRALGSRQVKGKEAPVGVHEVLRPSRWRSRLDVYAEQGLTPLVGRERELDLLRDGFEQARGGHGQIVLISGDPGIGNSRVLHELKRRLEGETLTWLEGRCIAYGADIAYLPAIEVVKQSFGVEEHDGEAEIIRKLESGAAAMGAEVGAGLPLLKALLAVDPGDPTIAALDPRLRKARTFEALRALTAAGSAIRPLVIVHEDLHWVDRLSEELLTFLADAIPGLRVMLLLTHRPGYEHRFGERPTLTRLSLRALSADESATLAERLLAVDRLPAALQQTIAGRAEGNPFFVEEVVRSLLDDGALRSADDGYVLARPIEEIQVPATVQDVIMARLDRLDEGPKRAIQAASAIGREFSVRVLDRTVEARERLAEHLRHLKAVELVYERALYPELAFMFKHALTQDVAYDSMLLARRRTLHRLIGEAIEALYADRLGEHHETLAYHFERAEQWDRALDHLILSGDKALAAFAPFQAVAFYDRALAAATSGQALTPERAIGLHFAHGQARLLAGDRAGSATSFETMLRAARDAGDLVQEGRALYQLSVVAFVAHRFEDAIEYAERSRHLAEENGDRATLSGGLGTTAFVHAVTGDLETARGLAEESLREARKADAPAVLGFALHVYGHVADWRGDHDRSLRSWDELMVLARRHELPAVLMRGLWTQGLGRCGRGDYTGAIEALEEGLALSPRFGDVMWRCRDLNTLGWVYIDLCNWELAIQYNAQGIAESRSVGDPEIIRNAELNLADCYLALGRLDEAERHLEIVRRESSRQGTWGETWMKWRYTLHLQASLGELHLARGEPDEALAYAEQCLRGAEAAGATRYVVKGRRLMGTALLAQGRLDDAERELDEALRTARQQSNPAQLWLTLASRARVYRALDRGADAAAGYREALAVVEGVAARLTDPALGDTLLASAQVAALAERPD